MKAPIITVIGCLSFAAGCLLVSTNVEKLATRRELLTEPAENAETASILASQILACLALSWPLLLILSITGFIILYLGQRPVPAVAALVLPTVAMVYTVCRLPQPSQSDLIFYARKEQVECICRVESAKSNNSTLICRAIKLLLPDQRELKGKFLLSLYGGTPEANCSTGQYLRVCGKVYPLTSEPPTWQGTNRRRVSSPICARLSARCTDVKSNSAAGFHLRTELTRSTTSGTDAWTQFWQNGRQSIIRSHRNNLGERRGDLLSSMVIGDRVVRLQNDLKSLFREVGLSHLLAASGFNLSIVVASSYFLARLLPLPSTYASFAALFSTACFVFLAGPSPSVVRAAILCVLLLAAKLFSRRLHGLAALSLTLLIALMFDPLSVCDVGLQLSYIATAGIIAGMQWTNRNGSNPDRKQVLNWLRDTVSVICLAQLSILPLQLLYFKSTGLLFLPANLAVDPVVAPITVLGFASSMVAFVCPLLPCGIAGGAPLIEFADKITAFPLDYMINCASFFSSCEGATIGLGPPLPFAIPTYYLCLIFFLYTLPRKHMRLLGSLVLLVGIVTILFRPNMPGELVYLSKTCAFSFENRNAKLINNSKLDWHGKQILAYSGSDRIRPADTRLSLTNLDLGLQTCALELKDFVLIASLDKSKSSDRKPLSQTQLKEVIEKLRRKRVWHKASYEQASERKDDAVSSKPILIWAEGKRTTLKRAWRLKNTYIGSVGPSKPLLMSHRGFELRRLEKGKYFHPFRVNWQSGCVLVLK